jgi:hypothetical protein
LRFSFSDGFPETGTPISPFIGITLKHHYNRHYNLHHTTVISAIVLPLPLPTQLETMVHKTCTSSQKVAMVHILKQRQSVDPTVQRRVIARDLGVDASQLRKW